MAFLIFFSQYFFSLFQNQHIHQSCYDCIGRVCTKEILCTLCTSFRSHIFSWHKFSFCSAFNTFRVFVNNFTFYFLLWVCAFCIRFDVWARIMQICNAYCANNTRINKISFHEGILAHEEINKFNLYIVFDGWHCVIWWMIWEHFQANAVYNMWKNANEVQLVFCLSNQCAVHQGFWYTAFFRRPSSKLR